MIPAENNKEPPVERSGAAPTEEQSGLSLDRVSFDEMNLVELPFALLTRDTDGIYEIPLSPEGKSRLACLNSSEYGLPNSLAPRVMLGLMSMWKNECDSATQTFTVKVRDLVTRYMYPNRYKTTWPNGDVLQAVERQINCIANTRIHTDRWYDKERQQRIKANISLISDVTVLEKGGPKRHRVLRVTWGLEFFQSMVQKYTKPLDAGLVQRLEHPIDLQLYRLLDRQLAEKPKQTYTNIVDFARYKLGMQGNRLNSGGRTASGYVARKLAEAIRRLDSERFTVRMTIDRAVVPFRVTFELLATSKPRQPHEVHDDDLAGDLVREFLFHAHGVPRGQKRMRIAEADRANAREWLEVYGQEKARWMVERCIKVQRDHRAPEILTFRGLQLYERAAAGAYDRQIADEANRREQELSVEFDSYWNTYRRKLAELFDTRTSAEELARLEAEERQKIVQDKPDLPSKIVELILRSRLHDRKVAQMNGLGEDEFRAHRSLRTLRDAVRERHAVDMLEPTDESTEAGNAR